MSDLISTSAGLTSLLDGLGSDPDRVPGFDLEADNLHRYAEQLCLVQVCDGEGIHLVDPLAIDDLTPLGRYLEGASIWLHGADFDMRLIAAEFGILPGLVLDTQIAARLVGEERFSYANLVEGHFGVVLSKSSQKENWGQRPLPEKMCEYARNDVRYLLPLADQLVERLREKDRYHWFLESCEAAMDKVRLREGERAEAWRVQGSGKLNRRGLSFLKALWNWRDREAREWDRPTFMVAKNKQLVVWAQELSAGKKPQWPRGMRRERMKRLDSAVKAAEQEPSGSWPERKRGGGRRWETAQEEKYKEFASKRDAIAGELGIEAALLAPRAVIEQLVWEEQEPADLLLNWQRELLEV